MNIGLPVHDYDPATPDQQAADYLIEIVNNNSDKLALVAMPAAHDDDQLDQLEQHFARVYELAKARRPHLSIKVMSGVHNGNSRIVCAIHEHHWIGGYCIRCDQEPESFGS